MKVEQIIEELQKLPAGIEVCIFDWRRNLSDDNGEGSGEGIHPEFSISMVTEEEIVQSSPLFAVMTFNNDDYEDDGSRTIK